MNILNENNVEYEIHADIIGYKRKLNVDFAIPNSNDPKLVIEVSKVHDRKYGDIQRRIFFLDHKFQLAKLSSPKLKTMMFIKCMDDNVSVVKGIFDRDVVNTDFCIVNSVKDVFKK